MWRLWADDSSSAAIRLHHDKGLVSVVSHKHTALDYTSGPQLQHNCNILATILQRFLCVRNYRIFVKIFKIIVRLLQVCHIIMLFIHRE